MQDNPHIFADYFIKRMARCFGSAESDGFINGIGADMPTGILSENGAAIGVTASEITFDDVIRLYFSVDKQFRQRGAWPGMRGSQQTAKSNSLPMRRR